MSEVFWMVFSAGNDAPKKRHESLEIALGEASRIAHKNGAEVFVLRAVKKITPKFDVQADDI